MTASATAHALPLTLQERLELPDKIEVKASLAEYFDFAADCEYRVEYSDGKIISMGLASITHEALVSRIDFLLNLFFGIDGEFHVLGSNCATFIPGAKAIHNADLVVLKGKPQYFIHQGKKKKVKALTNPYLLVEVLSKTTRNYDFGTKIPRYKGLPSVQHILVVDQQSPYVALYSRTKKPGEWLNMEVTDEDNGFVVLNRKRLKLKDIYKNIVEE